MPLRVAIAGAGIGGLALATGLCRAGHRVTVFDKFAAPAPVGSGLIVQPVGMAVLEALEVAARVQALGAPISRMLGHEVVGGRPVLDVSYETPKETRHGLAIHRSALFGALLEAATQSGVEIVPNHEVCAASDRALTFTHGTTSTGFDLVVDASGAGSRLSPLTAKPLPYGAVWATVDWPAQTDLPKTELRQAYKYASQMLGVLPIGRLTEGGPEKAAIFYSLPAEGYQAWRDSGIDAWRSKATEIWPAFAPFAAQITQPDQMVMARYSHGSLRTPYSGGVIFIGDSAHRASPQLGQGANMALLDAHVLTLALADARDDTALAALNYARARRAHMGLYQLLSGLFTPQYQSNSRLLPILRDRLLFPLSQTPPLPRVLTKLVCGELVPPLGSFSR